MNQQEFPRYHEPMKPIALSQNETKYKNMRLVLLMTLILSVVNCVSVLVADTFFYFSAYLPLLLIIFGASYTAYTGAAVFYIIFAVLALLTLVPYLLCYIFSKKHVGWMIAALALFSVDTVLLLVDLITAFDTAWLICFLIHLYVIFTLAMGVKYGLAVKKEKAADAATEDTYVQPDEAYVPDVDGSHTEPVDNTLAEARRTITVIRKKSFVGCAVTFACYADNRQVFTLKNGKTDVFEATGESFVLRAGDAGGLVTGEIPVPAGTDNLTFEVSMKMGMVTNYLEFKQIPNTNI